jgi:hypothetical protein
MNTIMQEASHFVIFTKYSGDQIKEDHVGNSEAREEVHIKF